MLAYMLILVVALVILLFGLQDFFETNTRQTPALALRATCTMMAGVFLVYFWFMSVSAGNSTPAYPPTYF